MATLALVPELAIAGPYLDNQCPSSRYGSDLNCTAKDVQLTGMRVVGDQTSCVGGETLSLDLEVTVNFATPDRYDVAVYLSNDGNDPQLLFGNGGAETCKVSVLPTASPFLDLDADTCGDGNGGITDPNLPGTTGSGILYIANVEVLCQSHPSAAGQLYVPFVLSWDHQAGNTGTRFCGDITDPVPGTKSKCNSPTIAQGTVQVGVMPTISMVDNQQYYQSGDTATYDITIANTVGAPVIGAVFTDPAVTGFSVTGLTCSATGGATCPAAPTIAAMQGTGITVPDIPDGGTVTFQVTGTLSGTVGQDITNTAHVTLGGISNSASDTNTIVDAISLTPLSQSKTAVAPSTVQYTYTLSNNHPALSDTVTLAPSSSKGWTVSLDKTSATVPASGSTTVTLTVNVPSGATAGTLDTTTIVATSGIDPSIKVSAQAVTTVDTLLTLTPDNTSGGGPGSSVYFPHRVQNNDSVSHTVSLATALAGTCTGWTASVVAADQSTALPSTTLTANGGFTDFYVKADIPATAVTGDVCTATVTGSTTASGVTVTASATDQATVAQLVLFRDPGYTQESYIYPAGNNVYARTYGLTNGDSYYYKWIQPDGVTVAAQSTPVAVTGGQLSYTHTLATAAPLGTWTVEVWNSTSGVLYDSTLFYVGPDHVSASYAGTNIYTHNNAVIDLELHDKKDAIPVDAGGNLVWGNPATYGDPAKPTTGDPLKISVTLSGSASFVQDPGAITLTDYTISGQTITGRLSSTTGTAKVTITDTAAETVTITPSSYGSVLYNSPDSDESASVTFEKPPLDHIELVHNGSAVTCTTTPVTVRACQDIDCTVELTEPLTVELSAVDTGGNSVGSWSTNPVTFTGSTTVDLSVTTAQTVTLGTTSTSQVPNGTSPQCDNGTTASCDLTFSDAGFIVAGTADGGAANIGTLTAGTGSGTYYLRAVETDQTTGACVAALQNSTQTVNIAYECNNPASCAGSDLMSISGTTIGRNDNGSVTNYTGVSLTFDATGNAPFTVQYDDVGQTRLWFKTTVNGATVAGSSNAFVVRPADFVLSNIKYGTTTNPAAADASGGVFAPAGADFSATVTAVTSSGTATPSYGQEGETVKVTATLFAPTDCNGNPADDPDCSGSFSGSFGTFSNGAATASNLNWSEVGIIELQAAVGDGDYLGTGDITGTKAKVGRFVPANFQVVATDGTLNPANGTFTYTGQEMSGYATAPKFDITPLNAAGAQVRNYVGGFMKLATSGFTLTDPTKDDNQLGVDGATLTTLTRTAGAVTLTGNADGTATYEFGADKYTYTRDGNSQIAPYTAEVPLKLTALTDQDGVQALEDTNGDGTATAGEFSEKALASGVAIRYGRAVLLDTFGRVDQVLPMRFQTEHYDGTHFVPHPDTDPTAITAAADTSCSIDTGIATCSVDGTAAEVEVTGTDITSGNDFTLTPTAGKAGMVTLQLTTPDWLKFDWDNDAGTGDANGQEFASGSATFGVYRGDGRFYHWREER